MKIILDGLNLALRHGTGIAAYGRRLLSDLSALGHQTGVLYDKSVDSDPDLAEIQFFDTQQRPVTRLARPFKRAMALADAWNPTGWLVPTARRVPMRGIVRPEYSPLQVPPCDEILTLPDLFARAHRRFQRTRTLFEIAVPEDVDVVHWTSFLPIRARSARPGRKVSNIYTVHDIIPLKLPFTTLDDKQFFLRMVRAIAASADGFVAVSDSARDDFIALTHSAPERIVTTTQSLAQDICVLSNDNRTDQHILHSFELKPDFYFIFAGAIEPKKNIRRLLEAYIFAGIDMPLILVGGHGWMFEDDLAQLGPAGSPIRRRVRLLGYQPREVLFTLIRHARALVFPSLYEGFGLPVLEAMALGTAVLTSSGGALAEVAGDAAMIVDPLSVRSIRDGLERLAGDDSLVQSLIAAGVARAEMFAPENVQLRLADAYRRLCPGVGC